MIDSLLTEKQKKEIRKSIKDKNYSNLILILEKIKTGHAGTAKTKDKSYVIKEIKKKIIGNSKNQEEDFLNIGSFFCKRMEDVSKEIGIALIWRGYKFNPEKVQKYLLKIADAPNWEVREYAAGAFANTLQYNEEFFETIMQWAKHPSENVRRAVVFSALGLRDKKNLSKAFSILEPLMFDDSKYVRKNLGPFILGSSFGNKFPKETIKKIEAVEQIPGRKC